MKLVYSDVFVLFKSLNDLKMNEINSLIKTNIFKNNLLLIMIINNQFHNWLFLFIVMCIPVLK